MAKKADELRSAIQLAQTIVLTQGSMFIRDLLRKRKAAYTAVRIGVTKDEILTNLKAAIRDGSVTRTDLESWIAEVEGWGRQHVYLFKCTPALVKSPALASADRLQRHLRRHRLGKAWNSRIEPHFPAELSLGRVTYANDRLELSWHHRFEQWRRVPERDHAPETIHGDRYEFRAYRQLLKRSLLRLVVYPRSRKAGIFVQIPLADPRHDEAIELAIETGGKLFDWNNCKRANISKAIKSLDQLDLDTTPDTVHHGRVQSQNTKFAAGGATVEFDADPTIVAWKRVDAVRRVRRALTADSFSGQSGRFIVTLRSGTGLNRPVSMSMDGRARRVYLRAQMTSEEVWLVLDQILKHA